MREREEYGEVTMVGPVLVAYASRYGSTEQVARGVRNILQEEGLEVTLLSARAVRSIRPYQAVVLGAPIYRGRWHAAARRFLRRYHHELDARVVAVFALGPVRSPRDEREWVASRRVLHNALTDNAPWLLPVAAEVFGGAYQPGLLHFPETVTARLGPHPVKRLPRSDLRDWRRIYLWSRSLASAIRAELAAAWPLLTPPKVEVPRSGGDRRHDRTLN